MTSKRIAKKASKLGRTAKSHVVREVAMSDLAQAKRTRKKASRKKVSRKKVSRNRSRSTGRR